MARPVAGAVNVAMLAGLGQFLTTFLLDLGVCPACAAAQGPRRARTALGHAGTDAQAPEGGVRVTGNHQTLALLLFSVFVAVTLAITTWVSRNRHGSAEEFYAGGRLFSPMENGFAIAGDYMSAASFLGISGLIALFGYDGLLYSVGFLVAWLVVLFLVAELVRNCGRFTLADVVAARMSERPVRIAAGTSSVTVSVLYLVAQMVGAGSLVALLLGGTSGAAQTWTVIGVGALMVIYVSLGGMRATTWIQIVKAVLLLGGTIALTVLVLVRFHGDFDQLLLTAADRSGHGERVPRARAEVRR